MENNKLASTLDTLTKYMTENGENELVDELTPEILSTDMEKLDRVTDVLIALICKIGVDGSFQPNIHGIILDGCLEVLNEFRKENFN